MNKKRSEKAVYYTWLQVVLLYFWKVAEKSGAEKNNPFHSLCAVCGLCRLMQIF